MLEHKDVLTLKLSRAYIVSIHHSGFYVTLLDNVSAILKVIKLFRYRVCKQ